MDKNSSDSDSGNVEMLCISGDGVEFKAFAGAKFGVFWKAKKLLNPSYGEQCKFSAKF